ncbi:MAG: glycosyltransferase [Lysobacterales bacterium]
MRILHVIPSISPQRGGPSAALFPMLCALRESGLDCGVLTTNDDGPSNGTIKTGQWQNVDGVPVLAFPRKLIGKRWFDEHIVAPQAIRWLNLEGQQWDLLHVHAIFSNLSTRSMSWARKHGRPYICRPLGQLCRWPLQQKPLRKRAYLTFVEKRNLMAANRVHFTSQQEYDECLDAGIKVAGMVVPHGIHLPKVSRSRADQKNLSVVFLSRLDPKKGIERLIEGFSTVSVRGAALTLTIAGSGDERYEDSLKALAAGNANIHFVGWVAGEVKQRLLERADVFVLPSFSENFGVVVLEAMGAGVPVVLTPEVALSQQVEDAGAGMVIDGSAQSIADGIDRLASDENLRVAMGQAGRSLAEQRFSWTAVADALGEQYRQVLEAP